MRATDAVTGSRPEALDPGLRSLFRRLGEAGSADDVMALLEGTDMPALHLLSYFFGGALLANAVPHLVSGLMGRPFQSPFATPRGEGLSSSTVNLVWGFANLVLFYLLVFRVGAFDLRDTAQAGAFGLGMLLLGLGIARHFGRFNGGNAPERR
jgi:hypothetical protein